MIPYRPAAGALTPEVVGEKDLAAANSIFSALENLVVVVGPGIGGLLLLTGRPVIGVAVNAASFVVAAGLIARLRVRSRGGGERRGRHLQQLAAGIRALVAQPVALAVILFAALDSAVYGATSVLYVPLSVRLGTGPTGTATCWPARRSARLLGAGLANRLSGASRLAPVIMGSLCLQALPFLATVPVHSPALAALCRSSRASAWSSWTCSRSPACSATCPGTCSAACSASSTPWCWPASCWPAWRPASCSRTPASTSR